VSGSTLRQSLAVAGIAFGCVLDGMVIAYSSPALPSLLSENSTVKIDHHHASWIGSIHTLGAVLGCVVSIPAMRILGRRGATLFLMTLAYLIGFLLIFSATRVEMIIAGRFIGGIGLGMTLSITPVYLVEVTNPKIMGMLGVIPPLFAQIGLLVTYLSGNWLDWRMLSLTGAVTVLPFVMFVYCVPESPVHLATLGHMEKAERSLNMLGRSEDTLRFIKNVQSDLLIEKMSWHQYLDPKVLKPFGTCLGIMFFFQATGYNTIIAYSVSLFRESGQTIHEHLATGITSGVILASCVLALGLARIAPRKVLLTTSSLGTATSLVMLGTYYYAKKTMDGMITETWSWVPLLSMMMMITFFMIGYGAVAWTVMAEILPARVRSNLYPFTVAFSWVANFGFAKSFVYIQRGIGSHGAFWLYAVLTLIGTVFIRFCLPETKDKNVSEVAEFFNSGGITRSSSQETVVSCISDASSNGSDV